MVDDVGELQFAGPTSCTVGDALRCTGPVPAVDAPSWMRGFRSYRRSLGTGEHEGVHDLGTAEQVWVEKEALASVVQCAALSRGADYFSCRGSVSQSELHSAAQRHRGYPSDGQSVVVIHPGHHDPSGIDMTRDVQDRLSLFGARTLVRRIALNHDQIDQHNPPPNPAKLTDSRVGGYLAAYGASSWELDALDPGTLNDLITETIDGYMDVRLFDDRSAEQADGRTQLAKISSR